MEVCLTAGWLHFQHDVIIDGQPKFLPVNFTTLPQLLKKAGYATHMVGKYVLSATARCPRSMLLLL